MDKDQTAKWMLDTFGDRIQTGSKFRARWRLDGRITDAVVIWMREVQPLQERGDVAFGFELNKADIYGVFAKLKLLRFEERRTFIV